VSVTGVCGEWNFSSTGAASRPLTLRGFPASVAAMSITRFLPAALCVAALALAAPAFAAAPTIAKKTPGGTLIAETVAFNASNWKSLYTAYTINYKSHCPYAKFADAQSKARQQAGTLTAKITSARIAGNKAYLGYKIIHNGKVLGAVTAGDPDVYLKVGGLWYDEYEPNHGC
jgi:hypothetical protein